jgi:hypothetical protein
MKCTLKNVLDRIVYHPHHHHCGYIPFPFSFYSFSFLIILNVSCFFIISYLILEWHDQLKCTFRIRKGHANMQHVYN